MPRSRKAIHDDKEKRKSKVELITEGYMVEGHRKESARKKARAVAKKGRRPAKRASR